MIAVTELLAAVALDTGLRRIREIFTEHPVERMQVFDLLSKRDKMMFIYAMMNLIRLNERQCLTVRQAEELT